MARRQQAQAGAINIRVHNHPTSDVYLNLLKSAYDLQRPLKARGEQMLLLSSLNKPKMDGTLQYVEGKAVACSKSFSPVALRWFLPCQ